MARSCCAKPVARIIKVADFEAGIVGLEEAFLNVSSAEPRDEEQLRAQLLSCVREFGNYISARREEDYKEALHREYKKFRALQKGKEQPTTAPNRT